MNRLPIVVLLFTFAAGCSFDPLNAKEDVGMKFEGDKPLDGFAATGSFTDFTHSFTTKEFVIVGVTGTSEDHEHDYSAYIAPLFDSGDSVSGEIDPDTVTLELNGPGWAYLWGVCPVASGTRVKAVADGTRMIIETTSTHDRVYLIPELGSHTIEIRDASTNAYLAKLTDEGDYFEIDDAGTYTTQPLEPETPQHEFVERVKAAVTAESIEWPWLWP